MGFFPRLFIVLEGRNNRLSETQLCWSVVRPKCSRKVPWTTCVPRLVLGHSPNSKPLSKVICSHCMELSLSSLTLMHAQTLTKRVRFAADGQRMRCSQQYRPIRRLLCSCFVLQSLVPGLKHNFYDEHFTLFRAILRVPVATALNKTFFSHRMLILMEEKELMSRSTMKQLVVMVFY